ncbi:hypothetical protein [Candidatus Albibeggiatoa sp. nov. BB20]|uniref:hypothetical protein n=1 Tax=Candidatus Albibeggiatoa sp. nov. BB20 TaxID=3162723 RepID=UPI0033655DC4
MLKCYYLFKIQNVLPIILCLSTLNTATYAAIQAIDVTETIVDGAKINLNPLSASECTIGLTDLNNTPLAEGIDDKGGEGVPCDGATPYLESIFYDKTNIEVAAFGFFCFKTPSKLYGWGRHDCDEVLEAYYEDSGAAITIPTHEIPEFEPLPRFTVAVGEEVLFNAHAISIGGYQIIYNTQNAPSRRKLNQRSGQFSWLAEYEGQFDFEITAQELYSSVEQKAVLPVTIIVDDFALVDFNIDPEQLEAFTARDMAVLTVESMVAFRGNDIKDIPAEAFTGLSAQQLGAMTANALKAISLAQFRYIPISSFYGLQAFNLAGFSSNTIQNFTLEHLQAINPSSFKGMSDHNIAKILTNLSIASLDTNLLNTLLPEAWEIDRQTGQLNHPQGAPLGLRGLNLNAQPSVAQGQLEYYDELPNFHSNVSLGGLGNTSTLLDDMNRTLGQLGLTDVRFSQNIDGLLTSSGSLALSILPNIDNISQTHEIEQIAVSNSQGTIKFITDNQHRFEFIPSPKSTAALLKSLGADGQTTVGKSGDIVMSYIPTTTTRAIQTKVHVVAVFDAFVTPAPSQFCLDPSCTNMNTGLFFNQVNLRHLRADAILPETGRMVYADGTSQVAYPSVVAPHFFISGLQQIAGIKSVTAQNSGRQYQVVLDSGITLTLFPSFNAEVSDLSKGQHVIPSFDYNPDTQILTYTVAIKTQLFKQKLRVQ